MTKVIEAFVDTRENLLKGPYLSLALPYQAAPEGGDAFPEVPLGFVPWRHQRTAFDRLGSGKSTVVATGTGSGKTECFLLPILDHCRIHSGQPGIKAILIYPMNALASDQARRIARRIHGTPSLKGKVTAGIYIGKDRASRQSTMTEQKILSDPDVLVGQPPDILLTNYKMLDYLLSRPRDQRLWRQNGPETLRWLVVDELHTFDGAQGTDLACLIRRLKVRLGVGADRLVCAGTSATLGDSGRKDLVDYVAEVFGEPFSADSIIGESRQTIDEFLRESSVDYHLPPKLDLSRSVDPSRFESTGAYLRHQCEVFFGSTIDGDIGSPEWRSALGDRLRSHATFHWLLRVMEPGPRPMNEIVDRLGGSVPRRTRPELVGLINGLCALISHARSEDGVRPFLDMTAQVWVREMGRMVCSVSENASVDDLTRDGDEADHADDEGGDAPVRSPVLATGSAAQVRRLRHSDDLDPTQGSLHLPLVQCSSCQVTGWGAVLEAGGSRVGRDLRKFYNKFFDRDLGVRFLFPVSRSPFGPGKGKEVRICGGCGYFGPTTECDSCGPDHMVGVFVPDQIVVRRRREERKRVLSLDCPYCTSRDSLFIVGARSTVVVSAALAQLYGSHYNDDTRVIAFSDNVQDAAHRAAFVSHRTWRTTKRALIAQAVPEHGSLPLTQFPITVKERANGRSDRGAKLSRERLVDRFTAPDRTWLNAFREVQETSKLEPGSFLPDLVSQRLDWEAFSEAGFGARRSGSIQRARAAAVGPDLGALQMACEDATSQLREEIGDLEDLSPKEMRWIALGMLRRMLQHGAILSEGVKAVRSFLGSGCDGGNLHRNRALPDYGYSYSPLVYPCDIDVYTNANGAEPLARTGPRSWYQHWVDKVLLRNHPLSGYYQLEVLQTLLKHLRSHGLVDLRSAGRTLVWGVNPDRFRIGRDVRVLHCKNPARELVVPSDEAALWIGAPCLDLGVHDSYDRHCDTPPSWLGQMYRKAAIRRVWADEHTAQLTNLKRDTLQERFSATERKPLYPTLLSATPTLEMGIDIGDLSTVVLCSVPPAQANYLQRVGRAGRRDGNAFTLTVATARPHDLSFYANPREMIHGSVTTPGVFLNASAVLERQLTSFCLDDWSSSCGNPDAVPPLLTTVLEAVHKRTETAFPYTFFKHIARYRSALFDGFLDAFGDSLNDDSKEYLRKFLWGEEGGVPELELKILDRLERARKEQDAIRNDVRKLRGRLNALAKAPQDEATVRDRGEVDRERRGLLGLSSSLRNRDTFGFLTDEGLIPNYAFPQAGVTLRSVIVRQASAGEQSQADQATPSQQSESQAYQYMRPASAALSELAPDNRFYAEGHRVTIDRVNLALTKPEEWRLCPNCTHLEKLGDGEDSVSCPVCGDPMWADAGQVRTMLPLRLVHATTGVRKAQIGDKFEVRDPLFFKRNLVAEPEPQTSRRAFGASAARNRPAFGFEYLSATIFREMNFGRVTDEGRLCKFDGQTEPRIGFRVCRRCGRVQSRRQDAEPRHDWTCARAGQPIYQALPDSAGFGEGIGPVQQDPDIIDCLYLYREFTSESLTILMPEVSGDAKSQEVQSFVAAVELGLKERFRGKVDHIRAIVQRKLDPGQAARQAVLILYDTVPGGTGYLKELARTTTGLEEVFQTARDRIQACACNDGCYRCLRAFRQGIELPVASKKMAVSLLDRVLDCFEALESINSIDNLATGGPLESELEARFLSALRKRSAREPGMTLRNAIVRGRRGWALTINGRTWMIEPQVNLGVDENVVRSSRVDFLVRPPEGVPGAQKIAVFLDGFKYHEDDTGKDSIQRMALIRAGFLQWSLTWQDLEPAFGREAATLDLLRASSPVQETGNVIDQVQQRLDGEWGTGPLRKKMKDSLSSFDLLLLYLREPEPEKWRKAVFTDALRLFHQSVMARPDFHERCDSVARDLLPDRARDALAAFDPDRFLGGAGPAFGSELENATLLVSIPPSAIEKYEPSEMSFVLHLDDRPPATGSYREVWNGTLRLFNLVQFLSEPWWATASADDAGGYPEFPSREAGEVPVYDEWAEVFEEADNEVHDLLRGVKALDVLLPDEVGYELTNDADVVVAEAELAWVDRKVAVLRTDQEADRPTFEGAGWKALGSRSSADAVRDAVASSSN